MKIGKIGQYFPDGISNGVGFETAGRNLIKKRLKSVIVMPVQKHHLKFFVGKLSCQGNACKTTADDDYAGHACFGYVHQFIFIAFFKG